MTQNWQTEPLDIPRLYDSGHCLVMTTAAGHLVHYNINVVLYELNTNR